MSLLRKPDFFGETGKAEAMMLLFEVHSENSRCLIRSAMIAHGMNGQEKQRFCAVIKRIFMRNSGAICLVSLTQYIDYYYLASGCLFFHGPQTETCSFSDTQKITHHVTLLLLSRCNATEYPKYDVESSSNL